MNPKKEIICKVYFHDGRETIEQKEWEEFPPTAMYGPNESFFFLDKLSVQILGQFTYATYYEVLLKDINNIIKATKYGK